MDDINAWSFALGLGAYLSAWGLALAGALLGSLLGGERTQRASRLVLLLLTPAAVLAWRLMSSPEDPAETTPSRPHTAADLNAAVEAQLQAAARAGASERGSRD